MQRMWFLRMLYLHDARARIRVSTKKLSTLNQNHSPLIIIVIIRKFVMIDIWLLLAASFANILFLLAGLGQEDVLVFGPPGSDSQFIDWRWPH